MAKVIEAYEAEGNERDRLMLATRRIVRVLEADELSSADCMNVLTNLIAEIAIVACVDRTSYMDAMAQTYDLHIEHASHNETLN